MIAGVDPCVSCRYDIRPQPGDKVTCAECGTVNDRPFSLARHRESQRAHGPRWGRWSIWWLPLLLGAFVIFVLTYFRVYDLLHTPDPYSAPLLIMCSCALVTGVIYICGTIRTPQADREDHFWHRLLASVLLTPLAGLLYLLLLILLVPIMRELR